MHNKRTIDNFIPVQTLIFPDLLSGFIFKMLKKLLSRIVRTRRKQ